jgi:phosphonopyruvate decarboxylase
MISPKFFFDRLILNKVDFFCGVPDSLLKDFCAYVKDNSSLGNHIITANEGAAIALSAGYNLATNKFPLVYMQNSGLGNSINPLLSLADPMVYSIPMILLIGWRGEPNIKDEPQHVKQGIVTIDLLDAIGVKYAILAENNEDVISQLSECINYLETYSAPFAFVVRKNIFEHYELEHSDNELLHALSREDAIIMAAKNLAEDDIVVSTTGMISRELYEYREKNGQNHNADFLTVGSMGHASQIALGIALQKNDKRVFCFDGDGAVLMHLGSLAIIGSESPKNFIHIVFNNGAHDSVGGQPTVGFKISIPEIAKACGYTKTFSVSNESEFNYALNICENKGPVLIEIKVKKGSRADLGRPKTSPIENKVFFIKNLID